MTNLLNTGLFPLAKIGLQRLGGFVSSAFWFAVALLFGKRTDSKPDAASGSLYIGTSILSVLGTIALVTISFSGSFSAASAYAFQNGIDANVANYIPIAVDGLIVLCIMAIFSASLGGYSAAWLSFVVLCFTCLSIYFNIQHMPAGIAPIDRYLLGAAFPVIVFLASESSSWQIKKAVTYVQTLKTFQQLVDSVSDLKGEQAQIGGGIEQMGTQVNDLKTQINLYQKTVQNLERDLAILSVSGQVNEDNSQVILRKVELIRIKSARPATTQVELAELLGTTQKTISADIKELNGAASKMFGAKK